jgi:hypothetical protein
VSDCDGVTGLDAGGVVSIHTDFRTCGQQLYFI